MRALWLILLALPAGALELVPATVEVPPRGEVTLTLKNAGPLAVKVTAGGAGLGLTLEGVEIQPPKPATKWAPGAYQEVKSPAQRNGRTLWDEAPYSTVLGLPSIQGYLYVITWAELEPAPGRYDLAHLGAVLDYVQARNKHLLLVVMDRSFAGDTSGNLPPHIAAGCKYVATPEGQAKGYRGTFKWYLPACVDRIIALYKAIGARFDEHPALAGVSVGYLENALHEASSQPDFTSSTVLSAQQLRATVESKAAFPHTLVGMGYNWAPNLDEIAATFEGRRGFAFFHPDTVPGVYYGKDGAATKNEIRVRGIVPTVAKAEQTFIPASMPNKERQQWDMAFKTIGASFFVWGDGASYSRDYLTTNVLPFMRTNPPIPADNLRCPTTAAPCAP